MLVLRFFEEYTNDIEARIEFSLTSHKALNIGLYIKLRVLEKLVKIIRLPN